MASGQRKGERGVTVRKFLSCNVKSSRELLYNIGTIINDTVSEWVKVAQSCPILGDSMDGSPPGSSVYGFSRQEYWSGLPCPPSGDLPDPGIERVSLISPVCSVTGQGTKILTISPTPKQTSQMPETEAGFSQRNTKEGLANEGEKTQRTKHRLKCERNYAMWTFLLLGFTQYFPQKSYVVYF